MDVEEMIEELEGEEERAAGTDPAPTEPEKRKKGSRRGKGEDLDIDSVWR